MTPPLSGFLDDLRLAGIEVGLGDYQAVALLCERWNGKEAVHLGWAIAGILARNRQERQQIVDLFETYLQPERRSAASQAAANQEIARPRTHTAATGGKKAATAAGETDHRGRWPVALALMACVGLACVVLIPRFFCSGESCGSPASDLGTSLDLGAGTLQPPPPTEQPPPLPTPLPPHRPWTVVPLVRAQPWGYLALGFVLGLCGLLVGGLAVRSRRREVFLRQGRAGLERAAGARTYRLRLKGLQPPWSREELDGIATVLDRLRAASPGWRDLDVPGSLLRSFQGRFPPLCFESRQLNVPLLVLQDIGLDMQLWQRKVGALLDGLTLRGVVMRRFFFYGAPERVYQDPALPGVELARILAEHEECALLVLSSGAAVLPEPALWKDVLSRWPRRAWIHPAGDPALFPPAVTGLPVRSWPMTYFGLIGAAFSLVHDRDHRFVVPEARLHRARPVSVADVERLERLVRLYPHATAELVEYLRQRFMPEVPEEVIIHLRQRCLDPGSIFFQFAPAPDAPPTGEEVAAMRCLLSALDDSRPQEQD